MFNLDYYNTDHPEIVLGTFIKKKMTTQKYRSLLANTHDCLATPTSGECFTRDGLKSIFPMEETEWRICADMYVINWMTFWGEVIVITESLGRYRIHGNNNWASNVVTLESLKRDWEWAERKEKLINKILIANDMKRRWGAYILDMRAWLILIKTGELLADNMSQYAIKIIVSIFYSALSKPKKFFYFFWFFIVAILPMKNRKICNFVLNNYSLESIKKNIHFYA